MVGQMFLKVLSEREIKADYTLFASSKNAGKIIDFMGKAHTVRELTEDSPKSQKFDFALFSAGGSVSEKFAPLFAKTGCVVIDNSSHFRMHPGVPLVVPEVNPKAAKANKGIIANPNCSTIQAVVALYPLKKAFGLKRVIYSTYQAVSGAGLAGTADLIHNTANKFPHRIAGNILPHIDAFLPSGYTKEEQKMIDETKKILGDNGIKVTATTARVPVYNAHSESINVEFERPCTLSDVYQALRLQPGLKLRDEPRKNLYPTPLKADGKDWVYVGRVRIDDTVPSGINMWVVADNLRKGAATNAVQILQLLL